MPYFSFLLDLNGNSLLISTVSFFLIAVWISIIGRTVAYLTNHPLMLLMLIKLKLFQLFTIKKNTAPLYY